MEAYDTVVEAINGLKKQGYIEDLNLRQNCLECSGREIKLFHDVNNASNVYAISSPKHNLKGVMVNGYGISSEPLTNEMLEKLK